MDTQSDLNPAEQSPRTIVQPSLREVRAGESLQLLYRRQINEGCLTSSIDCSSAMKASRDGLRPLPTTAKKTLAELSTQDDVRWAVVEQYIMDSLLNETTGNPPVPHEVATQAATEIEMDLPHALRPASSRQWDTSNDTAVHGVRIRLIKLLLGLRETHRGELLSDELFLKRWTRTATIFDYHDQHWVRARREQGQSIVRPTTSTLAFPDDGTTSMFELGKRVWLNQRKPTVSRPVP